MKRIFDLILSSLGLIVVLPIIVFVVLFVWMQDWRSPFYIAERVGLGGVLFRIIKIRSMVIDADKFGINSTSLTDTRITPIGKIIRQYKIDELPQLLNVLFGDMSLVGPRPNVQSEVDKYTAEEYKLVSVRPGITDFASIVFSDEGEILKDSTDPDTIYGRVIRPGKSMLGLFYIEKKSLLIDISIIFLTIVAIFSRRAALEGVAYLLQRLGAPSILLKIARRDQPLQPLPLP